MALNEEDRKEVLEIFTEAVAGGLKKFRSEAEEEAAKAKQQQEETDKDKGKGGKKNDSGSGGFFAGWLLGQR